MAKNKAGDNSLKCSFCSKTQGMVMKLIAGPGVYICDECVELCNEIIEDEGFKPALDQRIGPLSSRITVFGATIGQLKNMSLDETRGAAMADSDAEQKSLIEASEDILQRLINHYTRTEAKVGIEPILRALLFVKEKRFGNGSKELLPVLEDLARYYIHIKQLHVAALLLEWIIEIGHASACFTEPDFRTHVLNLAKIYSTLGRTTETNSLLDTLYPEKVEPSIHS